MADTNLKKNTQGYGYKYTDLAEIHNYLEQNGMSYYQYTETVDGNDYIMTVPIIGDKAYPARRGCRVVQATLTGKTNPAQEQGSALTYARRYSLLMAFGLATTDDDAQCLTQKKTNSAVDEAQLKAKALEELNTHGKDYIVGVCEHYGVDKPNKLTTENCADYLKSLEGKKNE